MASGFQKAGATAAIWFGTGIICFGVAIYGAETQHDAGWLFVVSTVVASLLTALLWVIPVIAETTNSREKAKRQPADRLALLKELMDEDELAAFKDALKQRMLESVTRGDGELPYDAEALESLVSGDHSGHGSSR